MPSNKKSAFVMSLDFEMLWGVYSNIERYNYSYAQNVQNVEYVVPKLLELFSEYDIHATWATVAGILCKNFKDFENSFSVKDSKEIKELIDLLKNHINSCELLSEKCLFNKDLVELINNSPGQEIASHSFSHLFCSEASLKMFEDDLDSSLNIFQKNHIPVTSHIFPRNEFNLRCISILEKNGFLTYRDSHNHPIYRNKSLPRFIIRFLRFFDSYVPLFSTGRLGAESFLSSKDRILAIPPSLFLRPYSRRLKFIELIKRLRIYIGLYHSSRTGGVFHLWWHPHNFGRNINENLESLTKILNFYKKFCMKHGMKSLSMSELKNFYH